MRESSATARQKPMRRTRWGLTIAYLGDPDGGLKMIWSANALAAAGNVEEVARTYNNLIDVIVIAGRHQEAVDLGRETYGYSVAHGLGLQMAPTSSSMRRGPSRSSDAGTRLSTF